MTVQPSAPFPSLPEAEACQIVQDLEDLGYTHDNGVDRVYPVQHSNANVSWLTVEMSVRPRFHGTDTDHDQTLWDEFVRFRKLLAKDGFRLTGPSFDFDGFTASVVQLTPSI